MITARRSPGLLPLLLRFALLAVARAACGFAPPLPRAPTSPITTGERRRGQPCTAVAVPPAATDWGMGLSLLGVLGVGADHGSAAWIDLRPGRGPPLPGGAQPFTDERGRLAIGAEDLLRDGIAEGHA